MNKIYLILITFASVFLFNSCQAETYATEEEKVIIAQYDDEIATATTDFESKEKALKVAFKDLETAAKNPERIPELLDAYEFAFKAAKDSYDALEALTKGQDKTLEAIRKRTVDGPSGIISPFLVGTPLAPFAPFIPVIAALGGQLAFKRSRTHLKGSLKQLAKFQVGDAFLSYLKTLGLKHSNEDPVEVLKGARVAALEKKNTSLADKISAFTAVLDTEEDEIREKS